MAKHSKNNTSSMVFTHHERRELKYGTISERLGSDSIKSFDACSLCLHPVIEPTSCGKGHLFCKECIYTYLLNQKTDISKQLKKWEEQEQRLKEAEQRKQQEKREKEIQQFKQNSNSILLQESRLSSMNSSKSSSNAFSSSAPMEDVKERALIPVAVEESNAKAIVPVVISKSAESEQVPKASEETGRSKLKSFWVPGVQEDASPSLLKKPSMDTFCPDGKHRLRLKDLISLNFTENKENDKSSNSCKESGRYQCPVCLKTLTNASKAIALRNCGHVMCRGCLAKIKHDRQCVVCSKSFAEKDIIKLETGGTGYAGSLGEKLNATKTCPTAWL